MSEVEYIGSRKAKDPAVIKDCKSTNTWFNRPYSKNVKTRVGHEFLKLIDINFPIGSKLHKLFNRNTVKVIYSCMPNMTTIIERHNTRMCGTKWDGGNRPKRCNCCIPEQCQLDRWCLTNKIVYKATVDTNRSHTPRVYIGSTETSFKQRYVNHLMSFGKERYENQTELSKYIWSLKRDGNNFRVRWEILRKAPAYSRLSKQCDLCLTEKLMILSADKSVSLNKRSEIISKCQHQNKFFPSKFVGGIT